MRCENKENRLKKKEIKFLKTVVLFCRFTYKQSRTMSLLLSLIHKSNNSLAKEFEKLIDNFQNNLFGFESWRNKLWGNRVIKKLNYHLLYSLKKQDLFLFNNDLLILKKECEIIYNNIEYISTSTTIEADAISFRIDNLKEYIKTAVKYQSLIGLNIS